ncbi:MAG: DUF5995 family protein [Actinomycetota bacterium]
MRRLELGDTRPRRLPVAMTIGLVAILLIVPGAPRADHPLGNVPWSALLPPRAVPAAADPAQPCGAQPTAACVDGVIADMVANYGPLDSSCDPRAVFALTYLLTTEAFRETLGTGFFEDQDAIIQLDRLFADLFFAATDAYETGDAPPSWTIAFDAATQGRTNAVQDVFLGMNAHIQRDLPVALAAVGLVKPDGGSRKTDHDAVNEILAGVLDHIEDEVGRLYDPLVTFADASPSPVDEMGALEMLKLWREGAWRNAERLTLARNDGERALVMQQIETYSTLWAQIIAAADFGWYEARRFAYCSAAHQAA